MSMINDNMKGLIMSMTPIRRIPQMDSALPLSAIVSAELQNRPNLTLHEILGEMLLHDSDSDSFGCMMDWAMQIRQEFGISWAECIDAASILYYG